MALPPPALLLLLLLPLLLTPLSPLPALIDLRPPSAFLFHPPALHAAARAAVAAHGPHSPAAAARHVLAALHANASLVPHLVPPPREEWILNNAGGAMGAMCILHASLTEYLILFGTPLGTEGHTGRHPATDYFHILSGAQTAWGPDAGPALADAAFTPETFLPGDVHVLPRGHAKQYRMDAAEGCFALEYARGWIPGMLGFGLADAVSSSWDWWAVWRTVVVTGREMGGNLLRGKI